MLPNAREIVESPLIDIVDIVEGKDGFGPFGGLSLRINRPFSMIVNYANANFDAGVSYAPFEEFPLAFVAGFTQILPLKNCGIDPVNNPTGFPSRNMIPFISGSLGLSLDQQSFSF